MEKGLLEGPGLSFDQLLDGRVGFRPLQRVMCLVVYLLLLSEGLESMVIAIILPVLLRAWRLESFRLAIVTFIFLGITLGSFLQYLADHYGRKRVLQFAALLQAALGLLSCLSANYEYFLTIRFLYGIGIGIVLPLSGTLLTQISPTQLRTYTLGRSRIFFSLGSCISCLLAWAILDDSASIQDSNWRAVLLLSSLPGIIALFLLQMYGFESPRYLLVSARFEEGFQTIRLLMEGETLGGEQHKQVQVWAWHQSQRQQQELGCGQLFSARYKWKSVMMGLIWTSACCCYYNLNFVFPLLLQGVTRNLKYSVLEFSFAIEVISTLLMVALIDRWGRLHSLYLFKAVTFAGYMVLQVVGSPDPGLPFLVFSGVVFALKFVTIASFISIYPYTSETYQTLLRSKAMSYVNVVSRLAVAGMGLCIGGLLDSGYLFLAVGVLPLLSLGALYALNHETQGKQLDVD